MRTTYTEHFDARKVLGEKRGENRYIPTEPGIGYRLVAPVTRTEEATLELRETAIPPATRSLGRT